MNTCKRWLMLLFISLTCFFSLQSTAIATDTATTYTGIQLTEYADLPEPKPNQPVGPQSTPKTIAPSVVKDSGRLPQTNDLNGYLQVIVGLMLLLLSVILLLMKQQNQQIEQLKLE